MFFSVLEPWSLQRIRPHTSTLLQQGSFASRGSRTHALFLHQFPQSRLNPHLIAIVSNWYLLSTFGNSRPATFYLCVHPYTCSLSTIHLFAVPWTVTHKASLSMDFSRQEYWSGLLFPSPGDLLSPGTESESLASSTLKRGFCTSASPWEAQLYIHEIIKLTS